MKLLLLKVLLQRRARDEGYVLPVVIALGLVMILLGLVNITSASEENVNAITQNSRLDALGIAEVGVAQYRAMLDKNRILSVYNRAQWTSNNVNGVDVAGQTCDTITNTLNGWASNEPAGTTFSAANWRAVTLDETVIGRDLNNDGDATDTTVNAGWFKIVDYEYDIDGNSLAEDRDNDGNLDDTTPNDENGVFNVTVDANRDDDPLTLASGVTVNSITEENDTDDDGNSNARGILTIKGRTPDGSEAQIKTEIPLRINNLDNLAPVLWIGSNAISTPGPLNVLNGNIVLNSTGTGCPTPAAIAGNTNVVADARSLPSAIDDPNGVPAIPATGGNPEIPAIPAIPNTDKNSSTNGIGSIDTRTDTGTAAGTGTRPDPVLLPRPLPSTDPNKDRKNSQTGSPLDGRFLYDISSLRVQNNDLLTDGVSKVVLYVRNNIDIIGGVNVGQYNLATSNVSSHNLEIYGSSNTTTINIDPQGGTVNIEAFIHAPDATLDITGSGTVNINGAVWVNDINNSGGATINIRGDDTDTTTSSESSFKFYTTAARRSPRPISGSPTNWKTEEVN